ncbi:phospholipase B1, membrane-associated-like [Anguilla anguilla]|uniref:phospholipase B1, membrane-associated-like n=1 Tax=Anguilla anguilla TaxID=7936 RepID=UPI0015ACAE09|nr:phospholipase B1, membrane-associated-like [Anguilla anguilla]
MDIAARVTLPALLVALLGPLLALSVSMSQAEDSVADILPSHSPARDSEEAGRLLPLLCAQTSPSLSPPSSAHALRPSDIALVSAIGLPHPHRSESFKVLSRLFEILSMFNPTLTNLLPDQTSMQSSQYRSLPQQAEGLLHSLQDAGYTEDWKLLLLFVPVDELCLCAEQASTALTDTVRQVEETLGKLQSQLKHTLISAVVWAGPSDDVMDAQRAQMCTCEQSYSTAELRLKRIVLTQALQESLERHLQAKQWYSEREDFAVVLQASPIVVDMAKSMAPPSDQEGENLEHVALDLWRNLLQPMKLQSDVKDSDIMSRPCPSEDQPFLQTQRNSPSEPLAPQDRSVAPSPFLDPIMGTELPCEDLSPSNSPPTSVHALRPGDIKVVAAVGDSLTAGNGVGSTNNDILDVLREYRGLSWSIGGEANLSSVTTLPNILRQFNPSLAGFSEGIGDENTPQSFFNQAVPGAKSEAMPTQVRRLVDMMKNDSRINFQNDWKVITMFIGGNDLCDYCTDTVYFSPDNILSRIREALDILHREMPRALVNLVELMYMVPLRKLHEDSTLKCPSWLVRALCRCVVAEGTFELQNLIDQNRAYQRRMQELIDSGRYDTHSNFTVVLQPFFREVVLPLLEDGRPDRSYFALDCFHLSQKSHTLMARALWNNMLEPVGNKTHTQDFTAGLSLKCPSKAQPFMRTYENSNYTYQGPAPTPPPVTNWGSDFSCTDLAPSNPAPTSVHRLRPADIKVVATLGDSISTGFGAKSKNILQLKTEYRGVSWSIGGDKTLKEVTTLPNILRKFNPSLHGFSLGVGTSKTGFNMAVSGSKADDIPDQARKLIEALKTSKDVDFANDWKLVTLFIGGNDLCQYCMDRVTLSPQNYSYHLRESLDLLYQVPRVLVNVVEILQITGLRRINSDTLGCSLVQKNVCPCFLVPAEDSLELSEMNRINRLYQEESQRLVSGGRYDGREDFAVVTQPYFRNTVVPLNSDQKPDVSFFSVDCFHFSERGHAEMAIALWNNMLEPEEKKQVYNNFTSDRNKIKCPTQDQPYIFTRVNSFPSISTTTAPPTITHDPSYVPAWAAALLAVIGLLIGWGVTWLLLSCRKRRKQRMKESVTEMKGPDL